MLPTGQVVAIKCLSPNSRQGNREFFNEIKSLSNLQHRNVIKLLGYCVHRDEKSVVYEFTGNTCLRDNLVRGWCIITSPSSYPALKQKVYSMLWINDDHLVWGYGHLPFFIWDAYGLIRVHRLISERTTTFSALVIQDIYTSNGKNASKS